MKKPTNKRKIILFIFFVAFAAYVATHYKELLSVLDALSQGSWRWLLLAVVLQIIYYFVYTIMTKQAFLTVGVKRTLRDIYPLVLGALFVNVLAPTAGNSGTILFADDAARRKESSTKAVVGYLVSIISSYSSFFVLLIFAIIFLRLRNLLNTYEIVGSIIFIFPVLIPTVLLILSNKRPALSHKILDWIHTTTNKVLKFFRIKKSISKDWPEVVSSELKIASDSIRKNKIQLLRTLITALSAHILNIISLFVIFVAFDIRIHYGALIAGYVFAEVIRVISPQPEGVGAVEAVIVLIFTSFGVPPISATAIAITFRGLNFWAPLGLGFFYLQRLKSFSE